MGLKFLKGENGNWYLTNDSSPKLFADRMYFDLKWKPVVAKEKVKESVKLLSVTKESDAKKHRN